jgi:hypothetical protein
VSDVPTVELVEQRRRATAGLREVLADRHAEVEARDVEIAELRAAVHTAEFAGRRAATPVGIGWWRMLDGRLFFVAGFTPGGAAYGIYEDEMEPCDDTLF